MKRKLLSAILPLFSIAAIPGHASAAASGTTLQNLNTAYQRECNAANRYENFARQADSAGFNEIARLLRATAASEAIHRDIQKRAIVKLGANPETFKLQEIIPATTAENLKSAINDESEDSTKLYPAFLATAKADNSKPAIRAFNYALAGEKHHAEYFQQALAQIDSKNPITCYVCKDCGLMLTKLPAKKCPVCREGLKEFKKID